MSVEKLVKSLLGKDAEVYEYQLAGVSRTGWRLCTLKGPSFSKADPASALVEASWRDLYKQGVQLFVGPSVFRVGPGQYSDSWGEVEFNPADGPTIQPDPADAPHTCSQVFALPKLEVLDIIEFCKVGSHNAPKLPIDVEFLDRFGGQELMSSAMREMMEHFKKNQSSMRRRVSRMPHGDDPWRAVQKGLGKVMNIAPFAIQFADAAGLGATFLGPVTKSEAKRIGKHILEVNPEAMDLAMDRLQELGLAVPEDRKHPGQPDYEAVIPQFILAAGKFSLWWDLAIAPVAATAFGPVPTALAAAVRGDGRALGTQPFPPRLPRPVADPTPHAGPRQHRGWRAVGAVRESRRKEAEVAARRNTNPTPGSIAVETMNNLPASWHLELKAKASGLCSQCGYDLRATPDRCPECGTAAPVSAAASNP